MRYKLILFDNDDTLMDFQAGNRNAVNRLLDEFGYFHPDRYDQYEAVNKQCWAELEQGKMAQDRLRLERFTRFFARYPVPGDAAQAAERFVTLLGEQSILLPHALDVVRAIAAKLPVVILTNGMTAIQRNRFARSPLTALVADILISEEEGVSKPRPELFLRALDRFGVAPRDALMIGDGVGSDIRGANSAGIDACWYNPRGGALPDGVHAEYVITDIRDCVPIALAP